MCWWIFKAGLTPRRPGRSFTRLLIYYKTDHKNLAMYKISLFNTMAKTIETYKGMPVIEASDSKDLEKKLEKMEGIKPPFAVMISRRTKIILNSATLLQI